METLLCHVSFFPHIHSEHAVGLVGIIGFLAIIAIIGAIAKGRE